MLPARYRLTSRTEISQAVRSGARARRGALVVHVEVGQGGASPARAAFTVSKAVGDSVTRHRVVRRLRAITPPLLDRVPGGSRVVVRAMPEAATASSARLREDLERALERIVPLGSLPERDVSVPVVDVEAAAPGPPSSGLGRVLWWIGWPIRSLLIALIWIYRNTISPILTPTCRYHPSCSAYGFQALQVHGAAKGTVLAAWRVLRCNPFTPGGLDPVPARGRWKPDIHPDGTPRVGAAGTA